MILGIDLDDCIINSTNGFREKIENENLSEETLNRIQTNFKLILSGRTPEDLKSILIPLFEKFNHAYDLNPHAKETLTKLKEHYQIYIITSRGENIQKGSEQLTIEYLKEKEIPYDKIFFNSHDKGKVCLENGVDILIDDSPYHCESALKNGIKAYLFTSIENKNIDTDIPRINSWEEAQNILNNETDQPY